MQMVSPLQGCADNAFTSPFVTTPAGPPAAHIPLSPFLRSMGPALPPPSPFLLSSSAPGSSLPESCLLPLLSCRSCSQTSYPQVKVKDLTAHPTALPALPAISPHQQNQQETLRAWGKSGRQVTLLQIHKDLLKPVREGPQASRKKFSKDKALENKTH